MQEASWGLEWGKLRVGTLQNHPMFRTPSLDQTFDSGLEGAALTSLPSAILGNELLVVPPIHGYLAVLLASRRH